MEKFRNKTLLDRVVDKTKILSLALALHLVPSMAKGDTATINTPDTISNFKEDSQKYNNTALLKD
ncbi:MAG: hypothetical protein QM532_03395 [Cyanobium sp. MAG06]|nr:hypothetical protein [Cyanobium sp. MAG06]